VQDKRGRESKIWNGLPWQLGQASWSRFVWLPRVFSDYV